MLLNIILLVLVFGSERKKVSPYLMALILGLIKGSAYAFYTQNLVVALGAGLIYTALASAFVFFLVHLHRSEAKDRPEIPVYKTPGTEKPKFRWEYIPLTVLTILIVGGEALLTIFVKVVP